MNGYSVMRLCPLFSGMDDDEIEKALEYYGARRKQYAKGDTLLAVGNALSAFALVLKGSVQVMSDDYNGHHMIMAVVEAGQTFAESLCYRKVAESPVYAQALTACEVVWLRADRFHSGSCAYCERFMLLLTGKTLAMNDRIQVLSKLTLRDKLITLFSQYAARQGSEFVIPFDRDSLAAYLGSNRSALSRELSKMRADGVIEFIKNRFRLK